MHSDTADALSNGVTTVENMKTNKKFKTETPPPRQPASQTEAEVHSHQSVERASDALPYFRKLNVEWAGA